MTTRGLNFLTTRSLDLLTTRGLNFLTTRSLDLLTTRGLDFLTARRLDLLATRRLNFLTARRLDFTCTGEGTRRLNFLTTWSLNFLATRRLNFLGPRRSRGILTRARQRARRLDFLTLCLLTDHLLRFRNLGRARSGLRLDGGGGEGRHREGAHESCICSLHHVPSTCCRVEDLGATPIGRHPLFLFVRSRNVPCGSRTIVSAKSKDVARVDVP